MEAKMSETYVRIYDNVFSDELCDRLVAKFEQNKDNHQRVTAHKLGFTQLNFREAGWEEEQNELVQIYVEQAKRYAKDVGVTSEWPMKYALEDIRLKKYFPNDLDEFGNHVDVDDNKSSTRFLVFFVYLDDNAGGATVFPKLGINSPCRKGSMLMFPPLWTHLHAGQKPVIKPKYMCGSYLHYVSKDF